jgi:hypothetical protein
VHHFAEPGKERRKEAVELQESLNIGAQLFRDELAAAAATTVHAKALRNVNRAPGASLVFTTMPTRPGLAITNQQVAINERLHLGLPPDPNMPLHCACGHANGQYGLDPWHCLACVLEKGRGTTWRHDDVKYTLAHWVTRLGGRVRIEPRAEGRHPAADEHGDGGRRRGRRGRLRPLPPGAAGAGAAAEAKEGKQAKAGRKRFDMLVWGIGPPVALDVVVKHSLAPSHVERCARDDQAVLKEAEAEKEQEYRGLAEAMGAKFFAFAVETTGRLGQGALAFIRHLIQEGQRFKNVEAPKEVVEGIYRSVAMAVARGNADIVQENIVRSRLAEW